MKMNQTGAMVFNTHNLINCRGKLLDLSEPKIMGILNITPDSFYDGGKFTEENAIIEQAGKMWAEGADIIDIGAQSTRPGAEIIDEKTEIQRILPVVKNLIKQYPDTILSVDTFHASVAEACIMEGASIINDISGGTFDEKMFKTAGKLKVPYILMHMQGTPQTMQLKPEYKNVVSEVLSFLGMQIESLKSAGVNDIIIDPGFGFGKSTAHNFNLLASLETFTMLGYPVLAGISRKSMICKVLKINPDKALNGTTALNMAALLNGAAILRVHDVREAVETRKLYLELIKNSG